MEAALMKAITKFATDAGQGGMNRVQTIRATATKFADVSRKDLTEALTSMGLNIATVRTQIQVARGPNAAEAPAPKAPKAKAEKKPAKAAKAKPTTDAEHPLAFDIGAAVAANSKRAKKAAAKYPSMAELSDEQIDGPAKAKAKAKPKAKAKARAAK